MLIDFYLDPACPWCWATSRWLLDVQPHRDFAIRWRPMSLWRKNRDTLSEEYLEGVWSTHLMLRVCEAVREREGEDAVGRLYTVLGTAIHHDRLTAFDLGDALTAAGCDPAIAGAADDEKWDAVIAVSMDEGLALCGDDVGTPIVSFDGAAAIFGPIVSPVPTGAAAVALFDAVATLTTHEGFWELKRSRRVGPLFTDRPAVPELNGERRPAP